VGGGGGVRKGARIQKRKYSSGECRMEWQDEMEEEGRLS
jgi:hypothetical protein